MPRGSVSGGGGGDRLSARLVEASMGRCVTAWPRGVWRGNSGPDVAELERLLLLRSWWKRC
jgi:hypothetical protein